MAKRPETLDEVDWEATTDAFVRSARNMTLREIMQQAEVGAAWLAARGNSEQAEIYRRVAAVLNRRLLN